MCGMPLKDRTRGSTSVARAVRVAAVWAACVPVLAATQSGSLPAAVSRSVDFLRDVQPLFQKHCVDCHGPLKQKGGFRLDEREAGLTGGESHAPAIKPGDSAGSPLIQFVGGLVPDMRMPSKGEPLSAEEIGVLRAWIDQGAVWPDDGKPKVDPVKSHWAFQPVQRPTVPAAGHPVDAFVAAKLREKALTPSVEADRVTLVRRMFLVMLGVPPSPSEVQAFVGDASPEAYDCLVDRVLADTRYGERWGRHWLDVIRFAESNGFETNRERPNAWRFRDYVIAAFNDDKPYDQFIREQLAGDALGAEAGTGFLVGGPLDIVKSPDPVLTAQQRADELDDMVSTTGTAFLGLTMGCARCHTHKFDPIVHREYYAMAALFAGVQHGDRALPMPEDQKVRLASLDERIVSLEARLKQFLPKPVTAVVGSNAGAGTLRPAVQPRINEDAFAASEARFLRFTILTTSGGEPCIDELEVWSGDRNVALASTGTKATASGTLPGYAIHKLEHVNDGRSGNPRSWISNEDGRGWVQLEFPRSERVDRVVWGRDRDGNFGDRVATTYGIEVSDDGLKWRRVAGSEDRQPFKGPSTKPAGPTYVFDGLPEAAAAEGRAWLAELDKLRKEREVAARAPAVYAGNFGKPSEMRRFHRGDPMQPREVVAPGTLALYRPLALSTNTPEQERRVQLAGWIATAEHPLTARVLVNRVWQHHFGVGLVDTPNDFGRNGSAPTHPELLDWLASEFAKPATMAGEPARAWSIKRLHRWILTSATWRQSSAPRADALRIDGASRLLWRFPPRRLEAEAIRDGILAVSGNLDRTMGGPSFHLHDVDRENVYHYHPKEEFGPPEWRRMVYAYKVRMEQDGIFGAFDCPDGSLVMPRRSLSTTPLQALNLFNSRFTLQQSTVFADRLRKEAGADPAVQVRHAWTLAYNRMPDATEARSAEAFVRDQGLPALCRAVLNSNEFLFIP
jgi:mono/diheme cytochrome c family protein